MPGGGRRSSAEAGTAALPLAVESSAECSKSDAACGGDRGVTVTAVLSCLLNLSCSRLMASHWRARKGDVRCDGGRLPCAVTDTHGDVKCSSTPLATAAANHSAGTPAFRVGRGDPTDSELDDGCCTGRDSSSESVWPKGCRHGTQSYVAGGSGSRLGVDGTSDGDDDRGHTRHMCDEYACVGVAPSLRVAMS